MAKQQQQQNPKRLLQLLRIEKGGIHLVFPTKGPRSIYLWTTSFINEVNPYLKKIGKGG